MEEMQSIGLFDSGLGGLTGFRALRKLLPGRDLVYFGDTARVPYGSKSREVIRRFALQDTRFLLSQNVSAVLVACGTVSSNALDLLEETFDLPFVGVVSPASEKASEIARAKNGRVLVLGTAATVRSNAYKDALLRIDPTLEVRQAACPLFVPLAENGHTKKGDIAATAIAKEYLEPFSEFRPDAVILGCTHFPLLSDVIADVLPGPAQVSAGEEAARTMAALVGDRAGTGKDTFFTSDDPVAFGEAAELFLGAPVERAFHTDIEAY